MPQARGDRMRGGDAAGGADRVGHGNSQSLQPADHPRAGEGAGDRRCGRRDGVGRGRGNGAWMRRAAGELGDRWREGSNRDGASDEDGGRSGTDCVPGRPHRTEAIRDGVESAQRSHSLRITGFSVDRRRVPFRLYLITDRNLAARRGGVVAVAEAALSAASATAQGGAVALQLREKDMEARPLYELARALRELCSRYGAALIVNDRVDVALAAGADGVHLPANSFAVADARRLVGATRLIGVSTHEAGEVGAAAAAGAGLAVYGP